MGEPVRDAAVTGEPAMGEPAKANAAGGAAALRDQAMIPADELASGLQQRLHDFEGLELLDLLERVQVLQRIARDLIVERLLAAVRFSEDEQPALIEQLWKGVNLPAPAHLDPEGQWLNGVPDNLHQPLRQRLEQLRLQKLLEQRHGHQVEPYFLERRADLEQVVYGVIRLDSQGVAEELYLRLLDGEAEFGDLAETFSQGEERYTRGLVGPMPITQPHPTIRQALSRLKVKELHAPLRLDRWTLLLRLEHRLPARLDEPQRLKLLQELFERELEQEVGEQLTALRLERES